MLNIETMKTIFKSDFLNDELTNWMVEQHAPDGYLDFSVKNRKLVLHDAGNRLLPNIPTLTNFILTGRFDVDWDINERKYSSRIHFGYDERRRSGLVLDVTADERVVVITLSSSDGAVLARKTKSAIVASEIEFELIHESGMVSLALNGDTCFLHQLDNVAKGRIALSRGSFLGEFRLSQFEIKSDAALDAKPHWDRIEIPFAPINGMDIPIVWTVDAMDLGDDVFQIDVELSGGEKSRPDVPWFPYHGHYVEFLDSPYLRIESEKAIHELVLSDETFILAQPTRHWFYTFHKEPVWPFKRTFFVRGLEAEARLFAGYKAYGNRAVNKHQEATRPCETVFDVTTRRVVHAGPAIPPGALSIDVTSPSDKRVCAEMPKTVHDYDDALEFARRNHYFHESEECRFTFDVTSRIDNSTNALTLRRRMENAFFEPLEDYQTVEMSGKVEKLVPGVEKIRSEELNLGELAPGVYHLRFQLFKNGVLIEEKHRAFEVNGQNQTALEASRMPVCFSMHNEVKACDTDYFDPWKRDCVDVSHYIQICNTIMPHFAREKRLWELLRIYKRQWFLWHGKRVMEDRDLERNRDLLRHCDHIFTRCVDGVFFRPAGRRYFHKDLVAILYDYAVENNFRVEQIKEALDAETCPDKETFDALVEERYHDFLDFLIDRHMAMMRQMRNEVRAINPDAKYASYGPITIYASAYKTAHSLSYKNALRFGDELQEIHDGFHVYEDYPHACRYTINRGPFLLADIKMRAPKFIVYPEMYNNYGGGVPCPDAAVARVFPSYGIRPVEPKQSLGSSIKRVLEFACACVWHDGERFDYWRDHGFQTRCWERERFEALLRTWSFIDKHPPVRPLKANVFISSLACCRHHRLFYDEYPGDVFEAFGDLFNTAEECVAYAYEMSRNAGQNAGFVAEFKSLKTLEASDVDVLVIPPLTRVEQEDLANIRRLHERGVPLLAFEEVGGLEDLFGVEPSDEKRVRDISVNRDLPDNPLEPLMDLTEHTDHRACVGKYRAKGADVLLDGEAPVLFSHRTQWGKTALFNIPPTAVRRQDQFNRVACGRDSVSPLINQATQRILKHLSEPEVETSAGKLIAFRDAEGVARLIVEEDAHPLPPTEISPLVTINLPDLKPESIHCDRPFAVIKNGRDAATLRLTLGPDEYAFLSIDDK